MAALGQAGRLRVMDRSRDDNQSDQWRKRQGAQRRRARLLASIPKRLIFVTVAAMAAFVVQFVVQNSESAPDLNMSRWIGRSPAPIAGVASVIDGDTIEIHGQRIRFNGIDAPESKQYRDDAFEYPCGRRAAEALDGFLAASKQVQYSFFTWDRYGRFVGDCRRADGASVASWMVEHGQALDWPRYSHGAYAKQRGWPRQPRSAFESESFKCPGNSAQRTPRALDRLHTNPEASSAGKLHKATPASRGGPAHKSARAMKQTGIWPTALGAASSIATRTASPVKAFAEPCHCAASVELTGLSLNGEMGKQMGISHSCRETSHNFSCLASLSGGLSAIDQ